VFKLNTELYPNGFNTWDSYGECLLALGKKEEGIEAYRKSFELNPKNKLAEAIVTEHK
jgi:tetratricopeptide (TPR) repeat protein